MRKAVDTVRLNAVAKDPLPNAFSFDPSTEWQLGAHVVQHCAV